MQPDSVKHKPSDPQFLAVTPTSINTMARHTQRKRPNRNRRGEPDAVGKYFGDAWSLAKRTASGLNEIRKLINIEEKILETVQTSTGFDTTGTVFVLSQVAQGTNYTERIGNSIKMQHIVVRWRLFKASAATASVCRLILFRDLDGYGTPPTTADVLQTVGATTAPLTPPDFLNRKRFAIVRDELLDVNSTGDSTYSGVWDVPHEGHILYLGSTAASASNGKGSLYMLAVSDESTNVPTIAFSSRIVFTDD